MRLFPELTLAAFIAGVAATFLLDGSIAPAWALLLPAVAAGVLAVGLRLLRLPIGPVLLSAALLLGFWRAEAAPSPALPIVPLGADITATLVVTDAPETIGSRARFRAQVVAPTAGAATNVAPGTNLLVYALPPDELVAQRPPPYVRHGDTMRLSGRLERPEPIGDFDYAFYLESRQISAILWARQSELVSVGGGFRPITALHRLRSALARGLQAAIPAPQSGLAQALLLGIRSELPQSVKDDFRTSGMSHLLAISGLHVGVVMALSLAVAHAVAGRRNAAAVAVIAIVLWAYATLSGLDPPVVRAAIMGSLVLGQTLLGRGIRGVTALLLAGAVMLAVDPSQLGSLSFLLSFTAMAGVILSLPTITVVSALVTAPLASSDAAPARWAQYGITLLVASAIISVMTTLATLPLIAMHFGAIPLMSVPATILAMPALPAALVASALTASVGLVSTTLAVAPGALAWAPLSWLTAVANAMPPALWAADWLTAPVAVAWYVVLGVLVWLMSARPLRRIVAGLRRRRWRPTGMAATVVAAVPVGIIVVVLLVGQLAATSADGRLHVYALDVGQGDAIMVVTPNGHQLLVDGGADSETTLAAIGPLIPASDRSLDVVAATHLDADHVGGLLGVLHRYRADVVLQGSVTPDSALYPQWQSVVTDRKRPALTLHAGHRVALGDGVMLEVLSPASGQPPAGVRRTSNNGSLVLRLSYGEIAFLFTGDIEADAERHLVASNRDGLRADVLKVAHHGSRTSSTREFLRAVAPLSAVISSGHDNRFGHPHPDVIDRLASSIGESNIFLTARDGTVEYISDGVNLWVKTDPPRPQ